MYYSNVEVGAPLQPAATQTVCLIPGNLDSVYFCVPVVPKFKLLIRIISSRTIQSTYMFMFFNLFCNCWTQVRFKPLMNFELFVTVGVIFGSKQLMREVIIVADP